METVALRSRVEFKDYALQHYQARMAVEKRIAERNYDNNKWLMTGYCSFCNNATDFTMDWVNSYEHPDIGKAPSYRERMVCGLCGLNNRQRFMAAYLVEAATNVSDLYLQEVVTPFFTLVKERLKSMNVVGSEYLGDSFQPGEMVRGVRHENALHLSFADSSLDILAANDVFEHVPDIERTLHEAHRVLRRGGTAVFSVPFNPWEERSVRRSEIIDNVVVHHLAARYHCNPVSEKGSLVFYDFGWDLIDSCKRAGFADAFMLGYYSLMHGHIGNGLQYVFVARKN